MAVRQLIQPDRNYPKTDSLPAQWILGLTDKQVQNVLRDKRDNLYRYKRDVDSVIEKAAEQCLKDYGELQISMGIVSNSEEKRAALGWRDLVRLTTAIGSQTLAIRGSDKSMFGKLFEKLILGSTLTILGFRRVNPATNRITDRVFWLSDARGNRESDATLIYRSGKLARFDIGFIGRGNPEISKDKLSRYEREAEIMGGRHHSVTFILVDRLPAKSMKTQEAAQRIGAEIIQMHWQYWPRDLARRLCERFEYTHPIQFMTDQELDHFLSAQLEQVRIQDFLSAVTLEELESQALYGGTQSEDPNI